MAQKVCRNPFIKKDGFLSRKGERDFLVDVKEEHGPDVQKICGRLLKKAKGKADPVKIVTEACSIYGKRRHGRIILRNGQLFDSDGS